MLDIGRLQNLIDAVNSSSTLVFGDFKCHFENQKFWEWKILQKKFKNLFLTFYDFGFLVIFFKICCSVCLYCYECRLWQKFSFTSDFLSNHGVKLLKWKRTSLLVIFYRLWSKHSVLLAQ